MGDEWTEAFEAQVSRVRDSGLLGRSQSLARLFDFLAEARRQGRSLREFDVAQEVFGRGSDLSGDASVRVYIHRLRKKLIDFYAGPGSAEPEKLVIPLGEYRLDLQDIREAPEPASPPPRRSLNVPLALGVLAAAILALNVGAWIWFGGLNAPQRAIDATARTSPWSRIDGDRPVLLVVGDYYIFGETDGLNVTRMIREFDVNSADDLSELLMRRPELLGRYVDMDTDYTPTGATLALKDVLPVLQAAVRDPGKISIVTSSMLTPEMLKTSDIVYVGYLSALRLLEEPVFAGARLKIGETYDDLIDSKTRRRYSSNAADAARNQANVDYGYLRAITGPSGNQIIVIAGTRDIGVMQMAEAAANRTVLSEAGASGELLFEVRGVGRTNISGRRIDLDGPR